MYYADSLFASRKKSRDNRRSSREIPGYLHAEKISFRFVSLSFRSKLFKLSESAYYFTFHRTAFLREKKDEKKQQGKISSANQPPVSAKLSFASSATFLRGIIQLSRKRHPISPPTRFSTTILPRRQCDSAFHGNFFGTTVPAGNSGVQLRRDKANCLINNSRGKNSFSGNWPNSN